MDIQKQITFLPVINLQQTGKFYEDIFGFNLVLDQGDCKIYRTCPNGYIGFCEREFEIIKGKVILTFVVENVEQEYKNLSVIKNIELSTVVHNNKYNIIHFFITDPNGFLIEIQKFNNPLA